MKKFLPVAGLLFTSISHLLGAYSNGSCNMPKNCPPKCPPKEPAPLNCDCPPPAGVINDCMPCVITPSAGPRVADGVDMFVTADFIYWTVREDGLGYATSGWRNGATDPAKGSVRHPNFKFKPGFKVGLGVNLGHDGWDTVAEYTWLYTGNMNNSVSQTFATSTLASTQTPGNDLSVDTVISSAASTYNVHFNNIDWELGRNFFVSRYLKIRPHFGLKGAWYTKRFNTSDVVDPDGVGLNAYSINQHVNFWGIGARTGFDTAWHFTKSFSIVGDVALSALWSQFKAYRKDSNFATDGTVATEVLLNTENSFHSLKPVLELFLGLRWDSWFSDDDFHVGVEAGWEEQVWFNHNQFYGIYEQGSHGDMFAQGFTLKVRFDF